jgi:hypothetical protein
MYATPPTAVCAPGKLVANTAKKPLSVIERSRTDA